MLFEIVHKSLYCDGNGIVFVILLSSNFDVRSGVSKGIAINDGGVHSATAFLRPTIVIAPQCE